MQIKQRFFQVGLWLGILSTQTLADLRQQLEQQMQMMQQLKQKIEQLEKQQQQLQTQQEKVVTSGRFTNSLKLPDSNTSFGWGGYVKLDLIYTDYGSAMQIGDDTLVPALIPLKGTAEDRHHDLNIHAKESRIWFKTLAPTLWGDLGTHVEIDFSTSDQGNERFSNSYAPRLREVTGRLGNWLLGQTWSTFMILDSKTQTNDFTGAVSETFMRQAQLRYTTGNFQIAVENPETTLNTFAGEKLATGDDRWPDLVGRVNFQGQKCSAAVAALVRNLRSNSLIADDNQWGWGMSVGGRMKTVGKDYVTWQANYGAIGRYITTNYISDGSLSGTGQVEPINLWGIQSSYQHWWTSSLRSTLLFGYVKADNPIEVVGNQVNKRLWSSHLNLLWSPISASSLGIEYLHAYRELASGEAGAINRIQLSGMYNF